MGDWPVERADAGARTDSRAWIFQRHRPAWTLLLLLGFILTGVLLVRLRKRRRQRRATREALRIVCNACREDRITPAEEDALLLALQEAGLSRPETVVESSEYFDTFVAPRLLERNGWPLAASIRRKLFGEAPTT